MKRKLLFILFAIMASIGMLQAEVLTGKCGDNLQYSLNTETGVLSITGSGAMDNNPNWSNYFSIKTIQLPEGLTTIGDLAFNYCSSVTSVTIPNSVTTIGDNAFYRCIALTSVTIPNSVTTIGTAAFAFVPNIVYSGSATDEENNNWGAKSLNGYVEGNLVYSDATKKRLLACSAQATEITIPNSVTTIGRNAFIFCSSLTSITIPNSVTEIGTAAFLGCSSLPSVTIPNSVTEIGIDAFTVVSNIVYSGSAADEENNNWGARSLNGYVEGNLVYRDATKKELLACFVQATGDINIPNSVTTIGRYAFFYCSSLTSVIIPNSVTTIKTQTFYVCSSLTSITIPNSVTEIGNGAFYGCSSLTSVTIPNSVIEIGTSAFNNCSKLSKITCEAVIPPTVGTSAFDWLDDKAVLYVPANSIEAYKKAEGWKEFYDIRPLANSNTDVENILDGSVNSTKKIYQNGQLYILTPDGKKYTPTGAAL